MATSLDYLPSNKKAKILDFNQNIAVPNDVNAWVKKEVIGVATLTVQDHLKDATRRKRVRDDALLNVGERFFMLSGQCMNAFSGHWASQYESVENPNQFSCLYQEENTPKTSPKPCLKLVAASLYLPKDDPRKPRGEDAHIVCVEENCIGVADGVGGWIKKGVDAGEYARELMDNSIIAIHNEPKGLVNPKRVLHEAYSNTKSEGSCTACIITLNGNVLRAANVGDSGFMLIRDGKVIYKSPVQQRCFNCPYQLGKSKDDPSVAQELEFNVRKGDIIVAGTDGLLDNMHAAEIEEIMCKNTSTDDGIGIRPEQKARTIANLALYNSFDKFADTPYSKAARKAGHKHAGGKIDDITVIVAYIEPSETL